VIPCGKPAGITCSSYPPSWQAAGGTTPINSQQFIVCVSGLVGQSTSNCPLGTQRTKHKETRRVVNAGKRPPNHQVGRWTAKNPSKFIAEVWVLVHAEEGTDHASVSPTARSATPMTPRYRQAVHPSCTSRSVKVKTRHAVPVLGGAPEPLVAQATA
jgi:hypothetical protein